MQANVFLRHTFTSAPVAATSGMTSNCCWLAKLHRLPELPIVVCRANPLTRGILLPLEFLLPLQLFFLFFRFGLGWRKPCAKEESTLEEKRSMLENAFLHTIAISAC